VKRQALMTALLLVGLLAGGGVRSQNTGVVDGAGAPPAPSYVMRGEEPAGGRLEAGRDGRQLYRSRCGFCHLQWGMGTNLLTAQRLAAGDSAASALLENRRDLAPEYVRAVVRNGRQAMPPLSRVEVTDAELDAIALYLGRTRP